MFHYRLMKNHETAAVAHLAAHVFSATVAPYFEARGVAEFLQYLAPHEMVKRLHHEHEVWVAEQAGQIIGMIEVRDGNHVTLFFVDQSHQGQGVGRQLLTAVIQACQARNPALTALSLHATPNAVAIYQRLGFTPTAPEQSERGMRFVPMTLHLATVASHAPYLAHHGKQGVHAHHP